MNKNDIVFLYKYNAWANDRILKAASQVSEEQFMAPAPFPHGGLRDTLTHTMFAEWIWRNRWQGYSPVTRLKAEDFPTIESLKTRWREEEKSLLAFVSNLTDESLNKTIDYKTTKGEPMGEILWQLMLHVVNHGTQHRSEAAAILTGFGQSPGDIDLVVYLREQ